MIPTVMVISFTIVKTGFTVEINFVSLMSKVKKKSIYLKYIFF